MRNDDGYHFIKDADGDTLLLGDPDEDNGERYIAVESNGDRQAVVLTEDQQEELLALLTGGLGFSPDQVVRAAIVQDLIDKSLTAGAFVGKSLSSDRATAILALASYIECGVDGVGDLSAVTRP